MEIWREVWRVCKPGAVLMAFGGTRTFHRLMVAIEDVGWEIADTLMWIHAQGFPKSHSIGKAIDREAGAEREVVGVVKKKPSASSDCNEGWVRPWAEGKTTMDITAPATPDAAIWQGWGTSLKPAFEPVILARKPRAGTYAANALAHGAGALWVDGGKVGTELVQSGNGALGHHGIYGDMARNPNSAGVSMGRWPSNLLLDETAAEMLGQVSRFFYTAKAARGERDAGLEGFWFEGDNLSGGGGTANEKADAYQSRKTSRHNPHPTVKPLDLCRYLATLLRPPEPYLDEARLLAPYAGSGSEMIGAMLAGWRNVTGIELEQEYLDIARARIAWWQRAYEETGLTDPKEILAAMKRRRAAQPTCGPMC